MREYNPLVYTSPSGKVFEFTYNGELSYGISHDLAEFEFSGTDGRYYQDNSVKQNEFTFKLSIVDEALEKEVYDAFLEKTSPGKTGLLEHPVPGVGSFPVVVSSATFEQNSVKGIGVTIVTVTFFRQIENLLAGDPITSSSAAGIFASVKNLNESQNGFFASAINLLSGGSVKDAINKTLEVVSNIREKLGPVVSGVQNLKATFDGTADLITSDIESLINDPLMLGSMLQNLIQLPMLSTASISDKVTAFKSFISTCGILPENELIKIKNGTGSGANFIAITSLSALAAVSGICYANATAESVSVAEIATGGDLSEDDLEVNGFLSVADIVSAINTVQSTALDVTETYSALAESYGVDSIATTGVLFLNQAFDYSVLNKEIIAKTVQNLQSRIFNLASEKIFVCEKDYNTVALCAKLYSSVDINTVKFLIQTNALHGKYIYYVPRGSMIKYY